MADVPKITYYVVMRGNGIFIIEEPDECGHLNPPQTLLRLFTNAAQARHYMSTKTEGADVKVKITDLFSIWNILEQVNNLSKNQFGAPVGVEVCAFFGDDLRTLRTLHDPSGPVS